MLILSIYTVLLLGATTMIYPFLLMIAGSTKSGVDTPETQIVPQYLVDDDALYRKDCEGFFNESLDMMRMALDNESYSFKKTDLPENPNLKLADEWERFLNTADLPFYTYALSYVNVKTSQKAQPLNLRKFKSALIDRVDGDLAKLNEEMDTYYDSWNSFYLVPESYLMRRDIIKTDPIDLAFREFKQEQPLHMRYYFSIEGYFKNVYLKSQYTKDITAYNKEHATNHASWADVHLARRYPKDASPKVREDWETFVRDILNLLWVRADDSVAADYQAFLKAKSGTLQALNRIYGTNHSAFNAAPIVGDTPTDGIRLSDWTAFVQGWRDPQVEDKAKSMHKLTIDAIRLDTLDTRFRDHLKMAYGTVEQANAKLGTQWATWIDATPAQEEYHYKSFMARQSELKWEYTTRNYVSVIDFIVLHGRAILNTTIYCSLAVLTALIINPLAAYALSRYKPPSAYKVLLFLMLTMAFPPLVTMIPQFLMLREFGFLNTFAALVLPSMANGYSIFLLKGFFDSLPQELYESAEIDGAGEFTIFWTITMSLSKPILAVIALNAFNLAYSNFMMALLICQDQDMWTLMPWLFQLQQHATQGVIFASLLIAAVPTFLIFVFCQNIIMRGIVVPVEK
jgi:ABC-type glycerol-3-phosphate transport system permease component